MENNTERIREHLEEIMNLLDIPLTESNQDTPKRVAKMWSEELFANRNDLHLGELDRKMKVFSNDYSSEMVIVKDIPFSSICEHHWLPFSGTISVGYVPSDCIIGLSKIPRVVKYFSKRPQLQEKLTTEVGEYLFKKLTPKALFVSCEAKHQCVMCRGAESDCSTVTYAKFFGENLNDTETKEFWEEFRSRT